MKPDTDRPQADWLDRAEEINDTEAAKVNGGNVNRGDGVGSSGGEGNFQAQLDSLEASFMKAQQANIALRKLTTEEGTELNAAKKDVNPK